MDVTILCDERTIEDLKLGNKKEKGWNSRPYYLINKIFNSEYFKSSYVELKEIENAKIEGIGVVHIDKTYLSSKEIEIIDALSKNKLILNKNLINTSKKHLEGILKKIGEESLIVYKGDTIKDRVIIKSNYNAGDAPQLKYKVKHKPQITEAEWDNKDLILQRFATSTTKKSELKRMDRYVIFLGEVVLCSFFSKEDIIKRDTSIWQYWRDIENLQQDFYKLKHICLNEVGCFYRQSSFQEQRNMEKILNLESILGLDFGSIDTITDENGKFYILDINKTTWERGIPDFFIELFRKKILKDYVTL